MYYFAKAAESHADAAEERVAELEATLDKVRSALVDHSPSEVLAILDDKEQS